MAKKGPKALIGAALVGGKPQLLCPISAHAMNAGFAHAEKWTLWANQSFRAHFGHDFLNFPGNGAQSQRVMGVVWPLGMCGAWCLLLTVWCNEIHGLMANATPQCELNVLRSSVSVSPTTRTTRVAKMHGLD